MAEPRTLADRMRRHFGDADHVYAHLLHGMAADWEAGGVVREICRGWEAAPAGAVVQLRLLAGLFRIVLTGRAPQLEPFYPCLGGTAPPGDVWPVALPVVAAHVEELHEALAVAPQTNEVGRSTALLIGLFVAVRRLGLRRVRLLEPGASAGLNLLMDRFRFEGHGWNWGPPESSVTLREAVLGAVQPEDFTIVDRRGCDPAPVDVTSEQGRLRLRSFVWPFQVERHERLAAALRLAAEDPPVVDRAGAAEWLAGRLDRPVDPGVLTVVWQSVTRQYWPATDTALVDGLIADALDRMPLAHVAMEYPQVGRPYPAELVVRTTGSDAPTRLGTVADHGIPVTLECCP